MEKVKEYTREELTVIWKSESCIHSGKCAMGLKAVFDPKRRPWIDLSAAEKSEIVEQVKKCPSGALSYKINGQIVNEIESNMKVEVNPTGPLIVTGDFTIQHPDGRVEERTGRTTLCRCGASQNKPFCDASHKRIEFKG